MNVFLCATSRTQVEPDSPFVAYIEDARRRIAVATVPEDSKEKQNTSLSLEGRRNSCSTLQDGMEDIGREFAENKSLASGKRRVNSMMKTENRAKILKSME